MKRLLLFLLIFGYGLLLANPEIRSLISKSGCSKDYPGKSELIIFDSTIVDVMGTGLSYVNIHKLVKILNSKGAKNNAVIKFGYDPLSAYVDIKGVKIYRKS